MGPILIVLLSLALFGGAFFALTAGRPPSIAQGESELNPGDLPVTPTPFRFWTRREWMNALLLTAILAGLVTVSLMLPKAPVGMLEFGTWRFPLTWRRMIAFDMVITGYGREIWSAGKNGWRRVRWFWLVYYVLWAVTFARGRGARRQ